MNAREEYIIFDPTNPPPNLPPDAINQQIRAYYSRPLRVVQTRLLWIVGRSPVTPDILEHAHAATLGAFRLASTGWQVIVSDHDQIALTVLDTCRTYKIEYHVYGKNKNPVTRVSKSLYRQVSNPESALLEQANMIVAFNREDIIEAALQHNIPVWRKNTLVC